MKNDEQKPIDVEVVEPNEVGFASPRSITTARLFKEHFLTSPPIQPLQLPVLSREDLESPFPFRFGIAIIFAVHYFEFAISPNGTLRAFGKLFARWFIALMIVTLAIGVPLLIAAQFLDSIASLIESTMRHLFIASLWIIGTICLWAIFIAGLAVFIKRKNSGKSLTRR
jgi:hypothetical protein